MKQKKPSLTLCLLLDLTGLLSYAVPLVGEITDIIWAPASAVIFYFLFGRKKFGINGAVFSFIEEIIPGLDFIPTFTIAWFIKKAQQTVSDVSIKKAAVPLGME